MKFGNIKLMAGASIDNLRGINLATDPDVGTLIASQESWIWYNTTDKVYKYFDGTSIKAFGEGGETPDLTGYLKADGSVSMAAILTLNSEDQSTAGNTAAVSKGYVASLLADKLSVNAGALTSNLSAGGHGISELAAPVNPTDAARKIDIENAIAGMNWQQDVDGIQTNGTLQPQKVEGRRYVLTDVTTLHADFGTIDGVVNNSIVQYETDAFKIVFVPTAERAEGAIAWNSATDQYVRFDGTSWANFGGMSSVTNGLGLSLTGNELAVKVNAAGGVAVDSDGLNVKLDGSSLSKAADGIRVANGGVGFAQIAPAAIGSGLQLNTTNSTLELDITAVKSAGFIDADGGEVASLVVGTVLESDNAVATRKFVEDSVSGSSATDTKVYVLDGTAGTAQTEISFKHNAGMKFGSVSVYDETGAQIFPSSILLVDENNLTVTFTEAVKAAIVFVAATINSATGEPEIPETPASYKLVVPANISQNSAYYVFLVPRGDKKIKNTAFSTVSGGVTLSNATVLYRQIGNMTAGNEYTFQCVVTHTDDTTETVSVVYTHAATTTNLVMGGHRGTATSATTLASNDRVNLQQATSKTAGIGLSTSVFASGLSIESVEFSLEPIGTRFDIDYSKITLKTGTSKNRVNVVNGLSDDEMTLVGTSVFLSLVTKFTMSDGSVIYPMDQTFTCGAAGAPVIYSGWTDAQLNA